MKNTFITYATLSLGLAIFFLVPAVTQAATLNFTPVQTSVVAGTTFTETIFVSSPDQALNAVSGTVTYPKDLLEVISVSKASSVLSLWVQDPTFSNSDGTMTFGGVVPNPGYSGGHGTVLSIQFRGKKMGSATIAFDSSSQVLANDGNGTDILSGSNTSTITITSATPKATPPPVVVAPVVTPSRSTDNDLRARITSSTHPDQTQWYKLSHAVLDWTNAPGVTAIRLGYDQDASGVPTVQYNDPISHKEVDLADGIWYFHVEMRGPNGWGPVSTYRVQVDTVPPLPFEITFPHGTSTSSGKSVFAKITAVDELSGIDHYQIAVDSNEVTITADAGNEPYVASGNIGTHLFLVRAYDKAGNSTSADSKFIITGPTGSSFDFFAFSWMTVNYLTIVLIIIAIICTLIIGTWYIRTHFSEYRRRLNHKIVIAHSHVHKEFDTLKDALTEELLSLENVKSERSLTREEERLITRFKKLLEHSEQEIEKEIEQIPS